MRQKSFAGGATTEEHPKHHLSRGLVQGYAVSTHGCLRSSARASFIFACEGGAISTTTSRGDGYHDSLGQDPLRRAHHDCEYVGKTG